MKKVSIVPVIVYLLFFTSCSQNQIDNFEPLTVISEELQEIQPVIIDNITEIRHPHDYAEGQELFDWENLQFIPLPEGQNNIPMPWNSLARNQFSEDIKNDYKKSDGWELYLASFSRTLLPGNKSFILYNKYRGILRYYHFVESGVTEAVSDYNILLHTLFAINIYDSPIANFYSQDIVDVEQNITSTHTYEPQILANYSWYSMDYELCYDKDIYNRSDDIQLVCFFSMVKANSLEINGNSLSELSAKLTAYGTPHPWESSLSTTNATLTFFGSKDIYQAANSLSGIDLKILSDIKALSAAPKLLNGFISSGPSVNLKWNVKVDATFSPNGVGVANHSFYVSGANLSSIQGLAPFYERALGVFYLNKKPVYEFYESNSGEYPYQYKLDIQSLEYLFNPAVLEVAEIKNIKQELVATEETSLIHENQRADLFQGHILKSNKPLNIQGVRVSFDVIPKDGGKTVQIIKTFKADLADSF